MGHKAKLYNSILGWNSQKVKEDFINMAKLYETTEQYLYLEDNTRSSVMQQEGIMDPEATLR